MGILGLELEKAAPNYRKKRFLAFLIDGAIVVFLWFLAFEFFGRPDFMAVKKAMDAASALPAGQNQAAMNAVFAKFDEAFQFGLILWFAYEVITTVLLNGRTLGKLLMGLQIVSMNPARNPVLNRLFFVARSALKMLSLYILQGFPFLICALSVLTSSNRSGFDIFVRTKVETAHRQDVLSR